MSFFSNTNPTQSKDKVWYIPKLTTVNDNFRLLLEQRGIAPDRVLQHVEEVRDRAWAINTYPCLGEFAFVWSLSRDLAVFPKILERMKTSNARLLDFGCGLGQDLRDIESQGVDSSQLAGFDLDQNMIEFGYELFNDGETFKARLFAADMLDPLTFPSDVGSFDFILANCAIHLFDWDNQILAARSALGLLKRQEGSIIFGKQIGRTQPKTSFGTMFIHNLKSFEKLWQKVADEFGLSLQVNCVLTKAIPSLMRDDPELRFLDYDIRVIEVKHPRSLEP